MDRYVLASQSPRRRELLHLVLNDYEVIPAKGEEVVRSTDPAEVVQELSFQKAMEVAKRLTPCQGDRMIVIGADTVVAVDGEILGKPHDRADAARMIGMLQGREHHVFTGVTICWTSGEEEGEEFDGEPGGRAFEMASGSGAEAAETGTAETGIRFFSFSEETAVDVFPMNRGEIEGYISLREPYDKAGAYGIQGAFSIFIRGIRGDYNNVVGLPAARLYHEMVKRGLL
ncbi:MAG: Maf family protein [Lachnospiraceae bacterium]|nr:Maf family protein [Lachnospiraceae bacterium]